MKVKEIITKLQQLDQEKNIYISYEYAIMELDEIKTINPNDFWKFEDKKKAGDYCIEVY